MTRGLNLVIKGLCIIFTKKCAARREAYVLIPIQFNTIKLSIDYNVNYAVLIIKYDCIIWKPILANLGKKIPILRTKTDFFGKLISANLGKKFPF